ncbi:uncharacterized protein LOC120110653 [Phoenix dactylifera]|uniref:Uncharacterized protein LOC120110653 n=1 Tax=Phoenix dactylifera TaxID=42345 RepID=A0A8B9A686_PHODC|nr:uncharacterized protein LOC120110653 [Phoenix dactylifera]
MKTPRDGEGSSGPAGAGPNLSWAEKVGGAPRETGWTNYRMSAEELEAVQQHFTGTVKPSLERLEKASEAWRSSAVIVRSLGKRVPAEWIGREARLRGKLDYEVEALPMAEGHVVVRFKGEEDREVALTRGPWMAGGQILAVERWRPDFIPCAKMVNNVLVWVRLPDLPLEFWVIESIMEVAVAVGRPIAVDGFTEKRSRIGFARVLVEVDASRPLRSRAFVRGLTERFWQAFVYESLPAVCYNCGLIGHGETECCLPYSIPGEGTGKEGLGDAEMGDANGLKGNREGQSHGGGGYRVFGPWLSTNRVRVQRPTKPGNKSRSTVAKPAGDVEGQQYVVGEKSSGVDGAISPVSPPDLEGWQKPTKVARRRSPVAGRGLGNLGLAGLVVEDAGKKMTPDLGLAGSGPEYIQAGRKPSEDGLQLRPGGGRARPRPMLDRRCGPSLRAAGPGPGPKQGSGPCGEPGPDKVRLIERAQPAETGP